MRTPRGPAFGSIACAGLQAPFRVASFHPVSQPLVLFQLSQPPASPRINRTEPSCGHSVAGSLITISLDHRLLWLMLGYVPPADASRVATRGALALDFQSEMTALTLPTF